MAYIINRFSGQQLVALQDGTLDTTTSIGLVGRNYTGYGEIQNENFLFLLENFANENPPARPLNGQTWFDTNTNTLNIYNGEDWNAVGSAVVNAEPPAEALGALWLNPDTNQLYTFNDGWRLIGPEAVSGFGETKLKSVVLTDISNKLHPVLQLVVNNEVLAIISSTVFTLSTNIPGFFNITKGITVSSFVTNTGVVTTIVGNLIGNSSTATALQNPRTINGITFDGQTNITISANTPTSLIRGTYLQGANFNGSASTVWSVDASPNNVVGTVVARDTGGNFSAGTITADTVGVHTGRVLSSTGVSVFDTIQANRIIGATLSGNSFSATQLETSRTINGVAFNGTANITVSAAAGTLTGTTLNSTVTASSLVSVGILNSLKVADSGLTIGSNDSVRIFPSSQGVPTIRSLINKSSLNLEVSDSDFPGNLPSIKFATSEYALNEGSADSIPALMPATNSNIDLGIQTLKWKRVYADTFIGTATTAAYADLAENYRADAEIEAGTVVCFGGEAEVTTCNVDSCRKVAGIVSTNPAHLMNADCQGKFVVPLALQGRVPCKVLGPISKGDMIVSAGNGFARAENSPIIGTVIGKALEDFNGKSGVIEVVVGRL
jgi:hypothetical protein